MLGEENKNGPSVLVVDDNPDVASFVAMELDSHGITVEKAYDGLEAMELVEIQNFDLILCDIKMPKMDGVELLMRCRKKGFEVPFIFLTGIENFEDVLMAIRYGVSDFLCKPFVTDEMIKTVQKVIAVKVLDQAITKLVNEVFAKCAPKSDQQKLQELRERRLNLWSTGL